MKRLLAITLCLALILSLAPLAALAEDAVAEDVPIIGQAAETAQPVETAAAEIVTPAAKLQTTPAVTAESVAISAGAGTRDVDVTLTISGNPGVAGAYLQLGYDPALTLKAIARGSALSGLSFSNPSDLSANPVDLIWDGLDADSSNGVLLTLTFTVPIGAAATFPVALTAGLDAFYDADMNNVGVALVNGGITVTGSASHTHSWGDGVVTAPAGCETNGEKLYTCSGCGETYAETLPATGHDWDDGSVTLAATETTDGEKVYTCARCGTTKTEILPATGGLIVTTESAEIGSGVGTKDVDLTLTLAGNTGIAGAMLRLQYDPALTLKTIRKGSALSTLAFTAPSDLTANPVDLLWDGMDADSSHGDLLTLTFTAPIGTAGVYPVTLTADAGGVYDGDMNDLGVTFRNGGITVTGSAEHTHTWDGGVVTAPAGCTADGVILYTCSACGETYAGEIPALGHDWDAGAVTLAPTETECGVKTYTCLRCGGTKTEAIPALNGMRIAVSFADAAMGTGTRDVDVTLTLSGNIGIAGAYLQLQYDPALTLKNITKGAALPDLTFTKPGNLARNPIDLLWDGMERDATNGVILTLTFAVPIGTETTYPVSLSYAPGAIYDGEMNDVDATLTAGGITVVCLHDWALSATTLAATCTAEGVGEYVCAICGRTKTDAIPAPGHDLIRHAAQEATHTQIGWESYDTCSRCDYSTYAEIPMIPYLPGDANGDDAVNAKDVTAIRQFLAGGYEVTILPEIADVNHDGVVNSKDTTILRRCLAGGYDVVLS